MNAHFIRFVSRLHKLFGLVIGFQLLFWTGSGLFFTLFPIETIHGDHLRKPSDVALWTQDVSLVPIEDILSRYSRPLKSAQLYTFLDRPIWDLNSMKGEHDLIDAQSGKAFMVTEEQVRIILSRSTTVKHPEQATIKLLGADAPREYGGPLPVYQVTQTDSDTRFYIAAATGELKAVRTGIWRLYDVLWRFHIMDLPGKDRFDSWWLKLFAGSAFLFVLTGFTLLAHRISRGRLFS